MSWPTKKLGEASNIVYGFAFRANAFNESGKGLPVIRISDVDKDKTGKFFDGKYDEKYLVKKGDILLGLSGSFKAARWEGNTALLNQRVATLRNFENDIAESFVFYQMPKLFVQFEKTITQLSVKNILTKHLENLKVLYPHLKIQKQIVEWLDKIAEAQKLNDKLIQKADELFQSLLHKELNPAGKDWEIKKLGDICEIARGGSPRPISKYLTNSSDGINWIKIGDVKEGEKYITSTEQKIKPEGASKTRLVKKGDFILSNSMSFGRPYILKISGAIHDGWLLLRLKNTDLSPDFLYYILGSSQTQIQFEKSASGGVVRNLNSDLVRKIKIPVPPLKIKKQIVEKLSAVQEYKNQLLAQKSKLKELFDSLLSKAFKRELI